MSQEEKPLLTRRSVVSCFIFKFDNNGRASVALFRRSAKVRTYQHLLAPISGSIDEDDASPLAAAWRELKEETQLAPGQLELLRHGKSYSFTDDAIGREWTIYPFAFRLLCDESAITTDWEHEGWGWYDPLEVEDNSPTFTDGVPRLGESLRRVWLEKELGPLAGGVLRDGLAQLANDHQSGARQLAVAALWVLRGVVGALECHDPDHAIRSAAWHLWKNGRESMGAAILAALLDALRGAEETLCQLRDGVEVLRWKITISQDIYHTIYKRDGTQVGKSLEGYLERGFASRQAAQRPISVLTLSNSSTIVQALHHIITETGFSLDLRVLESRPLFEGVSLAAKLAAGVTRLLSSHLPSKLSIKLYSDASMALAAQGVDLVLIGADRISASGAVSNKTGSLPAILSAKHLAGPREGQPDGVQIVVVSDSDKVAPPGDPHEHVVEDNGGEQLVRAWTEESNSEGVKGAAAVLSRFMGGVDKASSGRGPRGGEVTVRNVSFEWVPAELIDVYISELGILRVEDIAERSRLLGAEMDRFFGDL